MSGLFQLGDFQLASGKRSGWKIECDALGDGDWETLAWLMASTCGSRFGRVEGVPSGGLKLAEALRPWCSSDSEEILVVDDVWTTGGSMRAYLAESMLPVEQVRLAVVFMRAVFSVPQWDVFALFTLARGVR